MLFELDLLKRSNAFAVVNIINPVIFLSYFAFESFGELCDHIIEVLDLKGQLIVSDNYRTVMDYMIKFSCVVRILAAILLFSAVRKVC